MLRKTVVKICLGSSCFSRGNKELVPIIQKFIRKNQLESKVDFSGDHCNNECLEGPNLRIAGKVFHKVSSSTIEDILKCELAELLK